MENSLTLPDLAKIDTGGTSALHAFDIEIKPKSPCAHPIPGRNEMPRSRYVIETEFSSDRGD